MTRKVAPAKDILVLKKIGQFFLGQSFWSDQTLQGRQLEGQRTFMSEKWMGKTNIYKTLSAVDFEGSFANNSESENSFLNKFEENVTFSELYSFLKKHKEIKWNKSISHKSCACEVCGNTKLFVRCFSRVLPQSQQLPNVGSNFVYLHVKKV